jgi:hypothetical protein
VAQERGKWQQEEEIRENEVVDLWLLFWTRNRRRRRRKSTIVCEGAEQGDFEEGEGERKRRRRTTRGLENFGSVCVGVFFFFFLVWNGAGIVRGLCGDCGFFDLIFGFVLRFVLCL